MPVRGGGDVPAHYPQKRNAVTTKTEDGRDLTTAEWRTIPGLPKYEITPDGDVRNRDSHKLLKEWQNKTTGAYAYTLRKNLPDGTNRNVTRNYQTLLASAYPETR